MTHASFGEIYSRYFVKTVRIIRRRARPGIDAEEIAQAAWVKGFERLDQLRDDRRVVAWISTIATNLLRSGFRRNREVELSELKPELVAPPAKCLEAIAAREVLQACGVERRQFLEAFYFFGYSSREIGTLYNKPDGTVQSELSRARRSLQEQLRPESRQVGPRIIGSVMRGRVQRKKAGGVNAAIGKVG